MLEAMWSFLRKIFTLHRPFYSVLQGLPAELDKFVATPLYGVGLHQGNMLKITVFPLQTVLTELCSSIWLHNLPTYSSGPQRTVSASV